MRAVRRAAGVFALLAASVFAAVAAGAYDGERPRAFKHAAPGDFDYYALVLSWSPTHCLHEGDDRDDAQCDAARAHDFVLHGLWPQYSEGWPEDCYTGRRPWVPQKVIDTMRDLMPSKSLIIHEYATHGTCSGLSPEAFYEAARTLHDTVAVPPAFDDPDRRRVLSPENVEAEFMAANDWLEPEMIAVTCRRGNLFDIRLCFSRDLRPQACGANIDQRRLCPLDRINVTAP